MSKRMSTLALKQDYHGRNIYIFREKFSDNSKQWWTGYVQLRPTDSIYSLVKQNQNQFDNFYKIEEYVNAFLPITAAGKEEKINDIDLFIGFDTAEPFLADTTLNDCKKELMSWVNQLEKE